MLAAAVATLASRPESHYDDALVPKTIADVAGQLVTTGDAFPGHTQRRLSSGTHRMQAATVVTTPTCKRGNSTPHLGVRAAECLLCVPVRCVHAL